MFTIFSKKAFVYILVFKDIRLFVWKKMVSFQNHIWWLLTLFKTKCVYVCSVGKKTLGNYLMNFQCNRTIGICFVEMMGGDSFVTEWNLSLFFLCKYWKLFLLLLNVWQWSLTVWGVIVCLLVFLVNFCFQHSVSSSQPSDSSPSSGSASESDSCIATRLANIDATSCSGTTFSTSRALVSSTRFNLMPCLIAASRLVLGSTLSFVFTTGDVFFSFTDCNCSAVGLLCVLYWAILLLLVLVLAILPAILGPVIGGGGGGGGEFTTVSANDFKGFLDIYLDIFYLLNFVQQKMKKKYLYFFIII